MLHSSNKINLNVMFGKNKVLIEGFTPLGLVLNRETTVKNVVVTLITNCMALNEKVEHFKHKQKHTVINIQV